MDFRGAIPRAEARPQTANSDVFREFVHSGRTGSLSRQGGRRRAVKFKLHAETLNSAASPCALVR